MVKALKKVKKKQRRKMMLWWKLLQVRGRDFGKARKWARLLNKKMIPEEILKLYQDTALKAKAPRLFRTQLINKVFKKTADGEYVLCPDNPEFKAWKKMLTPPLPLKKQLASPTQ